MLSILLTATSPPAGGSLAKEWIRSNLPGSLLDSALQDDLEVTELQLSHPDVTPESLQVIVDLAQGVEPDKHSPSLALAHRYLNIPGLLYYTDSLYDLIPARGDITNPINKPVFDAAIKGNHSLIVGYYLLKGLIPTKEMFIEAIHAGSTNVVRLLQTYIDVTSIRNYALLEAVRFGHTDIVRMLLADPRVQKVSLDGFALVNASGLGHTEIVKLLLKEGRIDPNTYSGDPLKRACLYGQTDVVRVLLADPRTNFNYEPMQTAARYGLVDIIKLFLAHPKVDVYMMESAFMAAMRDEQDAIVELIKADTKYPAMEEIFHRM
jgi:ankyrin repeat protein